MKKFLTVLFILSAAVVSAAPKNYYMSSSTGNNGNTGQAPAQAWATLDKLNSMMNNIVAGDSILFKKGDAFYGTIIMTRNGTTQLPIIIASYGTGAKPIISGLVSLTGWTNVSGSLWECTPAKTLKKNCNILTINGIPQHVGRTPWMTYQAATPTTITSSSLTGTPNYTGAEVVIRKNTFVAEKLSVTAQSGSVLTTANNTQPINNGQNAGSQNGKNGNGFFLQRYAGSLDAQGEWYFNSSTNKMRIYSTVNPSTLVIKASYVDTVIKLGGMSSIRVLGLSVEGSGLYGIESYGATDIQVKNCDFNNNTKAVYIWNSNDALVDGNTFDNSFNGAILVSNNQAKRISVTNNYIHNTGQLIGMGVFNNEFSLRGIVARTSADGAQNFVNITGNTVIMTGNGAIQFQGSNVQVFRNVTDSFCNVLDDNGGIYTFVANQNLATTRYTNRQIKNNFISNAIGAPLGSSGGSIDVVGLYLDDQSGDIICESNTISNIPGMAIQLNNPIRDTVINNTVFNSEIAINVNQKQYGPLTGNVIKRNSFYPYTSSQFVARYTNSGLNNTGQSIGQALNSFAYMDSNYVRMKLAAGFDWYYAPTQGGAYTFPPDMTISTWRTNSGHDMRSMEAVPAKAVTLYSNPSSRLTTASFTSFSKHDPAMTVYNNSVVIPIWSSILLLDNGASTPPPSNEAPFASAGVDTAIILPGGMIYLRGSGADKDGTIATYAWTKVSGPAAGTITTPNAATTTVTDLVQGAYQYRLTITDNDGATAVSTVKVNVLPDIQPANFLILYGTKYMN